jgi:hypothetical protein
MSFNRKQYAEIFDFAEAVYLLSGEGPLREKAEQVMNWCEDVVGQQRPYEARLGKVETAPGYSRSGR